MFFNDVWLGFLCEQIIRKAEQLSRLRCPGCEAKLNSPVLHLHLQTSLLDKIKTFFDEIRGPLLQSLPQLYELMEQNLPHSDSLEQDRESYISIGRQFLMSHTCESVYFGRWITEFNDAIIEEGFKAGKKRQAPAQPVKKRAKKRVDKSH